MTSNSVMPPHAVQFYENDHFLIKGVADYIGAALQSGDQGIVIATADHLRRLENSLTQRGLLNANDHGTDPGGRYLGVEADHMLPLFMSDGLPNQERFRAAIGDIVVRAALEHGGHMYIFGEMVAILCAGEQCPLSAQGKHTAAVYVERYFNDLLRHYSFSLLCAYPLSAFPRQQDSPMFREVCGLHTEVMPAESYNPDASVNALQRTVANLQQQAYSLSFEVHDRQKVEQALREVNFDRLTGLPNRRVFHDRLEMDIKKAHRSHLPLALLFIDLDHFKEINDTLGHQTGDLLLQQVGQRLSSYVRETDTVARLGGDEFTITLSELRNVESATHLAHKILHDLSQPFRLGMEEAYISASIGITLYPQDGLTASDLLRNADQAMYQSKDMGRNRFSYFTRSMQETAQTRMALSNELRHAIGGQQLHVFYQPIIDMKTGRIEKAEALLRWRHPAQGLISPVDFIPIAEHTGMIVSIGDWVFHEALRHAKRWRAQRAGFTVSVNVSPAQFYRNNGEHYLEWLRQCKQSDGSEDGAAPPVGLEITEGLLLATNTSVMQQLLAFQRAGIQLSLDDFGTGYSSLSYLRKFRLDFLKIDQSFVHNLEHDPDNIALCEAIIVMAHKLGLQVIAEGVETVQESELLRRAGCDFAQGFLFGPALPPQEFETLLKEPA